MEQPVIDVNLEELRSELNKLSDLNNSEPFEEK